MSFLSDLSDSVAALAAEIAPRVVAVQGSDGRQLSGFIWRTGLVVTAEEVLEGDDEVQVLGADGKAVAAKLAGRDPSTDVALLQTETAEFAEWADAGLPRPGSFALLVGRGEDSLIARLSTVSAVGPSWKSRRGGTIDARLTLDMRPGRRSEGGAVVAPDGRLIGLGVTSVRGAIAIPTSTIARAVATLSEKGYVPRGWLGLMLQPLPQGGGTIVMGVEADSPAAGLGLLVGDVITTWDGEAVNSVAAVANRLGAGSVGQKAKLGVNRGGSVNEYDLTIGERPRS